MTPEGEKWVEELNRSRPAGGDVGIIHLVDAYHLLTRIFAEIEREATVFAEGDPVDRFYKGCAVDAIKAKFGL